MTELKGAIPADLARELCEALNLWDGGFYDIDEDELVDTYLAPVIARYLTPDEAI